jgi:hypothetical protein
VADDFGKNLKNTIVSGPVGLLRKYSPSNIAASAKEAISSAKNTVLGEVERGVNDFFNAASLRDFAHASRVFVQNTQEKAPKQKFLFHVHFSINKIFLPQGNDKASPNFGILVKNCELPKFKMDTNVLNQYNRKKIVQTRVQYDPISVEFHDDGASAVSSLWYSYYTYMISDGLNGLNQKTHNILLNKRNTYSTNTDFTNWGLSGGQSLTDGQVDDEKAPFFNYISVFGFNQKRFVEYRLVNPVIDAFSHDSYDYGASNGTMSNRMSIQYEAVQYYSGNIGDAATNIPGFMQNGYDTTASPLVTAGGSPTISGDSGLLKTIDVFSDPNASLTDKLRAAAQTASTFRNPTNVMNAAIGEAKNAILGAENSDGQRRNFNFKFPFGGGTSSGGN